MTADEDRYAGVVSRATAFVADATIVVSLTLGCLVVVQVVGLVLAGAWQRALAEGSASLLLYGPAALLVLYNSLFWSLTGRTPGMALLGLRVGRTDGRPLTWGRALVRALTLMFLSWGFLWSLVDSRRQALHDKFAGTVVLYDARPRPPSLTTGEEPPGTAIGVSPP